MQNLVTSPSNFYFNKTHRAEKRDGGFQRRIFFVLIFDSRCIISGLERKQEFVRLILSVENFGHVNRHFVDVLSVSRWSALHEVQPKFYTESSWCSRQSRTRWLSKKDDRSLHEV